MARRRREQYPDYRFRLTDDAARPMLAQRIIAVASGRTVIACSAAQNIVAPAPVQHVVFAAAGDRVVAATAQKRSIAAIAIDYVVSTIAQYAIGCNGAVACLGPACR